GDRRQRLEQITDLFAVWCPWLHRFGFAFGNAITGMLSELVEQGTHGAIFEFAPTRAPPLPPRSTPVMQCEHIVVQTMLINEQPSHLHRVRWRRQNLRTPCGIGLWLRHRQVVVWIEAELLREPAQCLGEVLMQMLFNDIDRRATAPAWVAHVMHAEVLDALGMG